MAAITKNRMIQAAIVLSAFSLIGLAQAQQGSSSGGSDSSGSASTSSGQSSQQPKSDSNQSNATDKGEEREKMNRNVKDTVQRDKTHQLKPSEYDPPK
jgi:hypothetical protein